MTLAAWWWCRRDADYAPYGVFARFDPPRLQALRDAGVPIAIATDHNPGSSPGLSLLLMLSMACTDFRLTPEEALRGVTVNGARALGLQQPTVSAHIARLESHYGVELFHNNGPWTVPEN